MVDMKKLLLAGIAALSVLGASAAHTRDTKICFEVPQQSDDQPIVTLSGRITKQHGKKWFRGTELRPAETLLLKVDGRLRTKLPGGDECDDRGQDEIAILDVDDALFNDAKWVGRHVTITGKLDRFVSAVVYPSIYIEILSIHRFGAQNK
jgi:hypothetical protein